MGDHTGLKEEMHELARGIDQARLSAEREDWGMAEKALTEAQDRMGRLLREAGDKQREMQISAKVQLVPGGASGQRISIWRSARVSPY